jgi:hypothetical protein
LFKESSKYSKESKKSRSALNFNIETSDSLRMSGKQEIDAFLEGNPEVCDDIDLWNLFEVK